VKAVETTILGNCCSIHLSYSHKDILYDLSKISHVFYPPESPMKRKHSNFPLQEQAA
jgi:hypothetical protein